PWYEDKIRSPDEPAASEPPPSPLDSSAIGEVEARPTAPIRLGKLAGPTEIDRPALPLPQDSSPLAPLSPPSPHPPTPPPPRASPPAVPIAEPNKTEENPKVKPLLEKIPERVLNEQLEAKPAGKVEGTGKRKKGKATPEPAAAAPAPAPAPAPA